MCVGCCMLLVSLLVARCSLLVVRLCASFVVRCLLLCVC